MDFSSHKQISTVFFSLFPCLQKDEADNDSVGEDKGDCNHVRLLEFVPLRCTAGIKLPIVINL
jgi:hypothetical protein